MIGYVKRVESFSAAHRLFIKGRSEGENAGIFGKCARSNGHGHNYQVEVIVKGPIDPSTGMIVDLTALKQIIWDSALSELDHSNIDKDIPYFTDRVR